MDMTKLRTLLMDADGVLWRANEAVPGLAHFFEVLKARRITWGVLTNNATRSVDYLLEKFEGFGVRAERGSIFTSAVATVAYLGEHYPTGTPVYVIGEKGLRQALSEAGYAIGEGAEHLPDTKAVVIGLDRAITYEKLTVASQLIRGGAAFIATNPDATYPTPEGLTPGAGSIVAAVATAAGVEPTVIGKPASPIYEAAMTHLGADPATTAMLGDRLETDIMGAKRLGLRTILVLSGVTSREDLAGSDTQPDLVFEDIRALTSELEKERT